MNFPFVDKVAKRFTKSASEQVKKEAKKTAVDLIPGLLTVGGMIFGFAAFNKSGSKPKNNRNYRQPYYTTSTKTTNNYFLGTVSDEVIKKILEERR